MGHAAEAWDQYSSMLTSGDFDRLAEVFSVDVLYLEPFNPPHRGNLLTQAYLKDYFAEKANVAVNVKRQVEDPEGRTLGVEWTLSYDAAGRRWNDLPRATFLEVDDDGRVVYQRDYS